MPGRFSHLDEAVLAVAVEAVDDIPKDLGNVDGDVQGADDARVAIGQAVLDVVQRCIDQYSAVVPGRALHPDGLVHCRRQGTMSVTSRYITTQPSNAA